MEITGNDYVIYSSVSIHSIENDFLKAIKQKWDNPIIEIDRTSNRIEFYFSKDKEMEEFSDANAFCLNESGEGIFLLIASRFESSKIRTTIVEEQFDKRGFNSIKVEPYESLLLFNDVWRYTLVLPSSLEDSKFSKEIYEYFISAIDVYLKAS